MKDLGFNHRARSWCKALRDWEIEFVTKTFRNLPHSLSFLLVFLRLLLSFFFQFSPNLCLCSPSPNFNQNTLYFSFLNIFLSHSEQEQQKQEKEIMGFKSLFHRKKKTESSNSLSQFIDDNNDDNNHKHKFKHELRIARYTNPDGGTRTSLQEIWCHWRRQDLGLWIRIHHGKLRPPSHRGSAQKDDCRGGHWRGWVYWPERVRGTEHKGCGFRRGHGESERCVFGLQHGWKWSHIGGRIAESDEEFGGWVFFFFWCGFLHLVCVLLLKYQDILISPFIWFLVFNFIFNFFYLVKINKLIFLI